MSTRSYICKENPDGSYFGIYCHYDGYPEYNGAILAEYYSTREKVEELLQLGDISSLHEDIAPPEGVQHSWESPCPGVVIAYHRDRGEEYNPPNILSQKELQDGCWISYIYVFCLDNKWRFMSLPLSDTDNPMDLPDSVVPNGYYSNQEQNNEDSNIKYEDFLK